jgi:hypothetical protein
MPTTVGAWVARFFLMQNTKMVKNISDYYNINKWP